MADCKIISSDNTYELIQINDHEIQFGGQGDGFCYKHQSFKCIDNLTDDERISLKFVEYDGDK